MDKIRKGIYKHYKNKYYEVINIARHSETLEEMVIYRALYDEFGYWVRPLQMFLETIEIDGIYRSRFEFVSEERSETFLKSKL